MTITEGTYTIDPTRVLAISPGIAIGPVRLFRQIRLSVDTAAIAPDQVAAEQHRLQEAIDKALEELRQLATQVAQTVGQSEAGVQQGARGEPRLARRQGWLAGPGDDPR